jgi:hemoglobin/transferrin/lactoferrin receptor protein
MSYRVSRATCDGVLLLALALSRTADSAEPESRLDEITVSATKVASPLLEVAATVSVIDSETSERRIDRDIKDLVRYEPNVSVRNDLARFGLADFNIRGIGGNRVLIEIDDVRIPDTFSIGSFSNASRDGVDIDLLKRLEIVRGSASSLYGSDAIGGVVAFTTKDPSDLIREERRSYFSMRGTYNGAHDEQAASATAAARDGRFSALATYTHQDTGRYRNQGDVDVVGALRTVPNPQDGEGNGILLKGVFEADSHVLRLTLEDVRHEVFTDLLTARSSTAALDVTAQSGDDDFRRRRVSFEHQFSDLGLPWLDSGSWRIYDQRSATRQETREARTVRAIAGISNRLRERRFQFDQDLLGAEVTFTKAWDWGATTHRLTLGAEYLDTHTAQLRDGRETNLTTGAVTSVVAPDAFPVRDFPVSDTRTASVYLQDEARLGRWIVTPGARLDRHELEPRPDGIFAADNPGIAPAAVDDSHVSPKLGVLYRATDAVSLFASYTSGFRFPPYGDVNVGFTNLAFGYTAIPNPDLEPESSRNFEAGVKVSRDDVRLELNGFYNDYDDFIQSFAAVGVDPANGVLVYQSQNLGRVRIYGAEAKTTVPLRFPGSAPGALAWRTAIGYAHGTDLETDLPVDTIDPLRIVTGLDLQPAGAIWMAALTITWTEAKDRVDPAAGLYLPGDWLTLDLVGELKLGGHLRLNAGIYNLTDESYWEWSDVRGRPASDGAIERYTRPGRSLSASLKVEF